MLIIPAIDLMAGKVVRLTKGKKDSKIVYSDSPADTAKKWRDCGAKLIHVVDLDAAFQQGNNLKEIEKIAKTGVDIEVGGGARSIATARKILNLGAKRVIIGTRAGDSIFLGALVKEFPGRLGAAVDVLNGKLKKSGWQESTDIGLTDFAGFLASKGIDWIEYTDIGRDGTLSGINAQEASSLADIKKVSIIISGGAGTINDLYMMKEKIPFVTGIILGKSLYEGKIGLKEAIRIFQAV